LSPTTPAHVVPVARRSPLAPWRPSHTPRSSGRGLEADFLRDAYAAGPALDAHRAASLDLAPGVVRANVYGIDVDRPRHLVAADPARASFSNRRLAPTPSESATASSGIEDDHTGPLGRVSQRGTSAGAYLGTNLDACRLLISEP